MRIPVLDCCGGGVRLRGKVLVGADGKGFIPVRLQRTGALADRRLAAGQGHFN